MSLESYPIEGVTPDPRRGKTSMHTYSDPAEYVGGAQAFELRKPVAVNQEGLLGTIRMSVLEWIGVPDNPRQRNTERHAMRAKHLLKQSKTHQSVAMAILQDGTRVKLDGHTRACLWDQGKVKSPDWVYVNVYGVRDMREAADLYDEFDNVAAVERATDRLHGALRENGIVLESVLLRQDKFSSAARIAWGLVKESDGRTPKMTTVVAEFKDELYALDSVGPSNRRFPTHIIAAALLTFKRYGDGALEFWRAYADGMGTKLDGQIDAVQALEEQTLKLRGEKKLAKINVLSQIASTLNIYERHRSGQLYSIQTHRYPMAASKLSAWLRAMRAAAEKRR